MIRRLLPPSPPRAGAPLGEFYLHDIAMERWYQRLAIVLGVVATVLCAWAWWA